MEDMAAGSPEFKYRRQNFPDSLKLYFDQVEYSVALHEIFKGLRKFFQVCQMTGIIPMITYGSEKLIYENRLQPFECIFFPRYLSYEQMLEQHNIDINQINAFDVLLNEGKTLLT